MVFISKSFQGWVEGVEMMEALGRMIYKRKSMICL